MTTTTIRRVRAADQAPIGKIRRGPLAALVRRPTATIGTLTSVALRGYGIPIAPAGIGTTIRIRPVGAADAAPIGKTHLDLSADPAHRLTGAPAKIETPCKAGEFTLARR